MEKDGVAKTRQLPRCCDYLAASTYVSTPHCSTIARLALGAFCSAISLDGLRNHQKGLKKILRPLIPGLQFYVISAIFKLRQRRKMSFQGLDIVFSIADAHFQLAIIDDLCLIHAMGAHLESFVTFRFQFKDGPEITSRALVAKKHIVFPPRIDQAIF
jgi:hypothetical protein